MHTPKPRSFCFNVYLPIICTVPIPKKRKRTRRIFFFTKALCFMSVSSDLKEDLLCSFCVYLSVSVYIYGKRRGGGGEGNGVPVSGSVSSTLCIDLPSTLYIYITYKLMYDRMT